MNGLNCVQHLINHGWKYLGTPTDSRCHKDDVWIHGDHAAQLLLWMYPIILHHWTAQADEAKPDGDFTGSSPNVMDK